MTHRKRLPALVLLAGVVAVSSALAGHSDTGFTVTSSLDGKRMQLDPIGSDPCQNRLAALQGTWTRGR